MPVPPAIIDRTVEAVVFAWDCVVGESPATIAQLRRRVLALTGVGSHVAVVSANAPDGVDRLLRARPKGPGTLWLCGLAGAEQLEVTADGTRQASWGSPERPGARGDTRADDGSACLRRLLLTLARRGVGPGLILMVGSEFGPAAGVPGRDSWMLLPGAARAVTVSVGEDARGTPRGVRYAGPGTAALLGLFDEQLRRRRAHRVPGVDEDPDWTIKEESTDPLRRRVAETICTLGAAGLATRGSVEEPAPGSTPLVLADGVYRGQSAEQLLPGPVWTGLAVEPAPERDERVLDLRSGVLTRTENGGAGSLRTLRFASITRPGVVALRAEAALGRLHPADPLQPPNGTPTPHDALGPMLRGSLGARSWARTGPPDGPGIAAVAAQRVGRQGSTRTLERIAAYVTDRRRQPPLAQADALLDAAAGAGFEAMLAEQRAAWADRWDAVDVRIPDDPATQLGVRFALFQLWCNVNRHDESAVGARGLSGGGYAGHVFWDADAFVLPAMLSIDPTAAGAMLRYRLRRLGAARSYAAATGYHGARFPWESASTGEDVTPRRGRLGDTVVPILTGQQEDHITADVAWAAHRCAMWSGTNSASYRAVAPLLADTARFWVSRCRRDGGGVHIDTVIGPDEYHESVNDNAFTNVMARWNLRAGADAARRFGIAADAEQWAGLADGLVDGYDPDTGRYEQFAGYFALEPLVVAQFATAPVAADLLLGRDRVSGSQIIKQPDVLMLHHLVPDEVRPGSLVPNLDFYLPRTAHGSSLSPSVTATLLARAGRTEEALEMLGVALTLDIGDTVGMTAAGLHLANLAGVWQAVLSGFAGVRVQDDTLVLEPRLPVRWHSLEIRFRCLHRRVRLNLTDEDVVIDTDGSLRVRLEGHQTRTVSGSTRLGKPARSSSTRTGARQ